MSQKWMVIGSYSSVAEANVVKSFLESRDVSCRLENEHIVSMNWLYSNAVGGVRLLVSSNDFERAKTFLEEVQDKKTELSDEQLEGIECPNCSSTKTEMTTSIGRISSLLSILLFSFPILFPFLDYEKWHCLDCKLIWKAPKKRNFIQRLLQWIFMFLVLGTIYYLIK